MGFQTLPATAPSTLTFTVPDARDYFCRLQVCGTFTGAAFTITGSLDGTNYTAISFINEATYANASSVSSTSTPQMVQINATGLKSVQIIFSTLSTGTAVCNLFTANYGPLPMTQIAGD